MSNIIFWDVDTQHDFMVPDGRFYIASAEHLAPNLKHLTEYARKADIPIVATVCDHAADDAELSDKPDLERTFPPHCLRHTPGSKKIPATFLPHPVVIETAPQDPAAVRALVDDHDGEILVKKQAFDVFSNPNAGAVIEALAPDHVVIYGVAMDVAGRGAIERFLERGATVHVVSDAVRAIRPESLTALLEEWRRRGVRVTTTAEIVERGYVDRLD